MKACWKLGSWWQNRGTSGGSESALRASAKYGLGPVGGRRLGFPKLAGLDGLAEYGSLVLNEAGNSSGQHDRGRLRIMQSDLCWPKTLAQVVACCHSLERGDLFGRSWWHGVNCVAT